MRMTSLSRLLVRTMRAGIAIVIGLAAFLAVFAFATIRLPSTPFEFTLKHGSSLRSVARQIQTSGLPVNAIAFEVLARVLGKGRSVKAGNYELQAPLSTLDLLTKITQGDVTQSEVTFIEGQTFAQMRKLLAENPGIRQDAKDLSDGDILKRIGATESSAEGLFFPDTYMFASGMSDLSILKRAYGAMRHNLDEAWRNRASNLPYGSPYEALIMASIVEKETAKPDERPRVAAVYVNRLKAGMLLQADPTVIYGLTGGRPLGHGLTVSELDSQTPYNTYKVAGLPPTPIGNPGRASLAAALDPPQTDELYFVADGTGGHVFSANVKDQDDNVKKWREIENSRKACGAQAQKAKTPAKC